MTEHLVLLQLKQLPDELKQEVLDFIGYLFSKHQLPTQKPLFYPNAVSNKSKPAFGSGAVKIKIATDFDAPLEDFKNYME